MRFKRIVLKLALTLTIISFSGCAMRDNLVRTAGANEGEVLQEREVKQLDDDARIMMAEFLEGNNGICLGDVLGAKVVWLDLAASDEDGKNNMFVITVEEDHLLLSKYVPTGQCVYQTVLQQELTEESISDMTADAEGNFYINVWNEGAVYLYDANGQAAGRIEYDNSVGCSRFSTNLKDNMINDDLKGDVYLFRTGADSVPGFIKKIDFESKSFIEEYDDVEIYDSPYMVAVDGDTVVFFIGSAFYRYSLTTHETYLDQELTQCSEDETSESESEGVESGKEAVVIAVFDFDVERELRKSVQEFNSRNEQYEVVIKNYYDENHLDSYEAVKHLTQDLVSDNAPDIVDLRYIIDIAAYNKLGLFDDLSPYLENSTELSKDDFFAPIVEGATYDNKLLWLTPSVDLTVWIGKSSLLGNVSGWSVEEAKVFLEKHPESQWMNSELNECSIDDLISVQGRTFIDAEDGTCHFDSPEFKKLLQFYLLINTQEAGFTEQKTYPEDLQEEKMLLDNFVCMCIDDYARRKCYFGEDVTAIGIPGDGDNSGCLISPHAEFAIVSQSENKQVAWEFLESMLSAEVPDIEALVPSFSSRKSGFAKQKEATLSEEHIKKSQTILMYGNWSCESKASTEQDVDAVERMIMNGVCNNITRNFEMEKILHEEMDNFLKTKNIDETAATVQNRISTYLSEKNQYLQR